MPTLSLTKLVTSQDTFGQMVEKINTNFDIISQAQGIKGEEGKRGNAGVPGPPGLMGPRGLQGTLGQRGSRWHFAPNISSYTSIDILNGDFFLEGNSGEVYERVTNDWSVKGAISSVSSIGESSLFNTFDTANGTIIKPKKTNYTLEITDIAYDSSYQATEFVNATDTANYTFSTIPPVTTESRWLQEMGLKIYTSEADSSNSTYYGFGKNMHLANSLASLENTSFGWDKKSGFTLTVDWDYALDSVDRHLEVLRIKAMPSGNVNHTQVIELSADRIDINTDTININAPLNIYNVDGATRTALSPELGTIVYDTTNDSLYAYGGSSPSWQPIQTVAGGGAPTPAYDVFKTFGSTNGSQTASSGNTTLRLKEGTGIVITSTTVNDPGPKQAWEIALAGAGSPGTNDFGSAKVHYDNGTQSFSISASTPGSILEFEEGDGIVLEDSSGRIKITATGAIAGDNTFEGFKYVFGQNGKGAFPDSAPNNSEPLDPAGRWIPLLASNDNRILEIVNLSFPTSVIAFDNTPIGQVDDTSTGTLFYPHKAGYWQINTFAFGLIEHPVGVENYLEFWATNTVVGTIQKNNQTWSHTSIAQSSFMNPAPYFNNSLNITNGELSVPWPTWTINCSDVIYLDEDDYVSVGVGLLYAPIITIEGTTYIGRNLWYLSGFISGTYLGDRP